MPRPIDNVGGESREEGRKKRKKTPYKIVQVCGNLFGVVGRVREFSSGRDIE